MTASATPVAAGRGAALLVAAGVLAMFVSAVAYRLEHPSRIVEARQQQGMEHGGAENQEAMAQVADLMARLRDAPQDAGLMVEIGRRFVIMDSLDRAEMFARRALAAAPENAEALNLLGIVAFRLQHMEEAEGAFVRLTELQPQYAPAHYNLGLLYRYHLNRPDEARKRFELAARFAGDNAELRRLLDEELGGK